MPVKKTTRKKPTRLKINYSDVAYTSQGFPIVRRRNATIDLKTNRLIKGKASPKLPKGWSWTKKTKYKQKTRTARGTTSVSSTRKRYGKITDFRPIKGGQFRVTHRKKVKR